MKRTTDSNAEVSNNEKNTYGTPRLREIKGWFKLQNEAEKYNKTLKEELTQRRRERRQKMKDEEFASNTEELVEKKYHKDKTKLKFAS